MVTLSEGLMDVCVPLKGIGIHLFNVLINFDDHRQIYLCNQPKWIEDYYHHKLYESSLYDNCPSLFQNDEHSLWPDQFEQPILHFGLMHYDNRYGMTVSQRREGYSAFYFFTGSHHHPHLPHFFINNYSFLNAFIENFLCEKQTLLRDAYAANLTRSLKKEDSPWGEKTVRRLQQEQKTMREKSKKMEENFSYNRASHSPVFSILSRRQKQVLYGLAQGYSAQEMADELYISRRTVERHLSLLKSKFPGRSYIELILELLNARPKEDLLTHL